MRLTLDGLVLHYELSGEGSPLLFVHGFPLSGRMWDPVVRRLSAEHRCIVPDLRGFGGSDASEQASMARYAADLVALLEHLGEARPVTVVGLSMGGYIAFELYRRHADRVAALALVDTRAEADSPEAARGRYETAERVLREGSGVVADALADRLFASGTDPGLRARWHRLMASASPRGVAAALRAMAERPDSTATLARLERPLLVAVGEADAITPPDVARRMHQLAPNARLAVIPGAGHMTPVEQPEVFCAVLLEFLGDREQGAGSREQ